MKFDDAKNLHNGDEVVLKSTGEAINVDYIYIYDRVSPPFVLIKGWGNGPSGYNEWIHTEVW